MARSISIDGFVPCPGPQLLVGRFARAFCAVLLLSVWASRGYGQNVQPSPRDTAVVTGVFTPAPSTPAPSTPAPSTPAPSVTRGPASPQSTPQQPYRIGAGDLLTISVWHEPDISRTVPVLPDGKIALPLVGEIQAAGKSAPELQVELTTSLTQFLKDPAVTVMIAEIRSQRVNVVGEVTRPGAFPLTESMGVVDAIAEAGGLREFAKRGRIYVLRPSGDGHSIRLNAHYQDVLRGRKNAKDVMLQAHDTVVVP